MIHVINLDVTAQEFPSPASITFSLRRHESALDAQDPRQHEGASLVCMHISKGNEPPFFPSRWHCELSLNELLKSITNL
jgi:hypothetical protein